MVQYNRARVDAWVAKVAELDSYGLSSLWHQLAFFPAGPVDIPQVELYREWTSFSLWEQQHALFEFVPIITKIASEQADALHRQAREKEPL